MRNRRRKGANYFEESYGLRAGSCFAETFLLRRFYAKQSVKRHHVVSRLAGMARCAVRAGSGATEGLDARATTFVPSPDATLGDGDGAARRPYLLPVKYQPKSSSDKRFLQSKRVVKT